MDVCPILLAAGQSQRFGSDKLLHPLFHDEQTKPLILHTLTPWLAAFHRLNVVIRDDNPALFNTLNQCEFASRLNLISAVDPDKGMSASLMTGINANAEANAWLIGLADMPFISECVINESLAALEDGAVITQPVFAGLPGHPVGFASQFRTQLLSLDGDKGAKAILKRNAKCIRHIQSPDDGIIRDIDLRRDL